MIAGADAQTARPTPVYTHPMSVSSSLRQIVEALGDRVYEKGKERIAVNGTLQSEGGKYQGRSVPIRVVKESPGYQRIDLSGDSPKTILDEPAGIPAGKARDEGDEELAELFGGDSAEGFLQGISRGGSLRKIGDGFVVKGVTGFGESLDIYELYAPAASRKGKPLVGKRYMFDSATGLLNRVSYVVERSGAEVPVQVILSEYRLVSGYRFPGKIVRMAGSRPTHTFTLETVAVAPNASDGLFQSAQ